jgi:hypothetical protein
LETLTPVQRVAVIAICLALTALIAMLLVPWVWARIVERLPNTATPTPDAMFRGPPAGHRWAAFPAAERLTCSGPRLGGLWFVFQGRF